MPEVLVTETRGAFSSIRLYQHNAAKGGDDGSITIVQQETSSVHNQSLSRRNNKILQNCIVTFRQIFLPYGYPETVSSDYTKYQIWDTIQAFCSSITGALATEAVMKGVGVGDETATTLAATMTWLLRSGSGMIGSIAFAWAKGTALDYNNKKWRLFADVLNDLATFIDLITPLFPPSVIILVFCCSSIARSLVGVAGGGTRAAITQHQARSNNSADVSAKDGSQETCVNLISLIVCLLLLPAVSGKTMLVWTLFVLITLLHIYSNYRAVKALQLETFNTARLLICLKQYLTDGKVPTIEQVNRDESVVIGFGIKDVDVCGFHMQMGVSIEQALTKYGSKSESQVISKQRLQNVLDNSDGKSFLIIPCAEAKLINVVLHENISSSDIIEAYVRAVLIAFSTSKEKIENLNPLADTITEEWEVFRNVVTSKGFNTSIALLETFDWRAKWKHL